MILGVKTKKQWINDIAKVPFIGGVFIFLLIFIVPVILSFLAQAFVPGLQNDVGFTKAMLVFLSTWNLAMWFSKLKLYLLFLPAWVLLGLIALVKIVRMYLESN